MNRYLFYVADTQVTNFNQDDVLGDGTVSFDPETSTLTLNNANIECEASYAIDAEDYGPITIKLVGENYAVTSLWLGVRVNEATIEGPGSLVAKAETGILSHNGLTISNGAKVSAEGTRLNGIYGDLTVKGEETIVQMKGVECGFKGSSLTLEDVLIIGLPTEAYFGEPYIVNLDGERIKDEWIIIASQDYIDGIENLKDSKNLKDLNDSTYNLAGQRVGSGYKGIVIEGGKKMLKK